VVNTAGASAKSAAQLFQFSKLGFRPSQLHLDLVRIVHDPLSQHALLGEQLLDVILDAQLWMRFCPEVREAYEAEKQREVVVVPGPEDTPRAQPATACAPVA